MESDRSALDDVVVKDLSALDLGHDKNHHHHHQNPPATRMIVCDAWYGFPTEKRPRKERILAVSKQIYNFLSWRCEFHVMQSRKRRHDNNQSTAEEEDLLSHILVIGKVEDVKAIHERINDLLSSSEKDQSADIHLDPLTKCLFLPGMTLEEIVSGSQGHDYLFLPTKTGKDKDVQVEDSEEDEEERSNGTVVQTPPHGHNETIVYLSPDADERLDPYQDPPRIVVVGMLVDRKIQPNRSKLRAQELSDQTSSKEHDENNINDNISRMQVKRLPMDNLRVVDLKDNEPLNIDTVMEIMERWWGNIRLFKETKGESLDRDGIRYDSTHFVDAAIRALHSHRKRHPKRTIHGGISTANK